MKLIKAILVLFAVAAMCSCEKENLENGGMASTSNSSESHNTGQNCINCHKSGGHGEGWFTAAGSLYNSTQTVPYTPATIELRTAQSGSGSLVASIDVDQRGNFYTTESIDFGTGLYASVIGATGTQYMPEKVTSGACNNCHDASQRMWAD